MIVWAVREGHPPSMVTGRPTTPRDLKVIFKAEKVKERQARRRRGRSMH